MALSKPIASRIIGSFGGAGGAWNIDNSALYGSNRFGPLYRLNAYEGGVSEPVTRLAEGESFGHTSPQLLPDGRHFLFVAPNRDLNKSAVYLATLGSFDRRLMLTGVNGVEYAPPDYLLFLRSGAIVVQRFDFDRARPIGEPKHAAGGGESAGVADFSVSQLGVLAYRRGARGVRADLVWRGKDGQAQGRAGEPAPYWQVFLSPDNLRAAVNTGEAGSTLAVLQLDNHVLSTVASGPQPSPFSVLDGIWSPDSRTLAYQLYGRSKTQILTRRLDEPSPRLLLDDGNSNYPDSWSPDGKWILGRRTGNSVIAVPVDGSGPLRTLRDAEYFMDQLQFSPDGKWVAYNSDQSGQWEVYVARFPEMDRVRQLSTQGGCQPIWRNDGKELFYLAPDAKLMSVALAGGPASRGDAPHTLFRSNVLVNCIFAQYAAAADGQKFLMIEPRIGDESESPGPLHVLTDWKAGLAK
jgi:eukaryotic-like serine/threonine-protein kinase